jgi:hypothetical protein
MRGLGYRPDPNDARDLKFSARAKASGTLPTAVDHSTSVLGILDQGATSSCVGHAWAAAIRLGLTLDGEAAPALPSPLAVYYWARAETGDQNADDGTFIRSAAKALQRFGFPPFSEWPTDAALVNSGPPHRVYKAAYDRKGMRGYQRIVMGDLDGIRRALWGGSPVVFGMTVRESFLDHTGDGLIDIDSGPIAGGHALCIVGYEGARFRIQNSWGTSWGAHGFAWVSAERMKQATDIWMADYDPSRGGAA